MIPGLERSPREGNGYPLQLSCLENSMDRGAWQSTVHEVAKSLTGLSVKSLRINEAPQKELSKPEEKQQVALNIWFYKFFF